MIIFFGNFRFKVKLTPGTGRRGKGRVINEFAYKLFVGFTQSRIQSYRSNKTAHSGFLSLSENSARKIIPQGRDGLCTSEENFCSV